MRVLPPVSIDFSKRQLLVRLGFYQFKKRKGLKRATKSSLVELIEKYENEVTREIETP
jgi:hypothetical protein